MARNFPYVWGKSSRRNRRVTDGRLQRQDSMVCFGNHKYFCAARGQHERGFRRKGENEVRWVGRGFFKQEVQMLAGRSWKQVKNFELRNDKIRFAKVREQCEGEDGWNVGGLWRNLLEQRE